MKKIFIFTVLFFSFLTVVNAQNPALTRPVFYAAPTDSAFYDSLNAEYGNVEFGDLMKMNNYGWDRYVAGWHYRLVQTRALFRAMGADSTVADSLARACLADHRVAERELVAAYSLIIQKMKSMDGRLTKVEETTERHSGQISTLAQGWLAEHGKNVSDRGDKKKKARAEIERILDRYLHQEGGVTEWKKSRIP